MDTKYQELIALGVYLAQNHYVVGSAGNLSLKLNNNQILCTPTNSNLNNLKCEEISVLSEDGTLLKGNPPTKEVSFHRAIYQKYNSANVVIHLHSTYLTALSCLQNLNPNNVLKPFTPYVVMRLGDVPLVPYFKPGSLDIATYIAQSLPDNISAFVLANHGVTVFGSSVKDALGKFEELEETAKLFFILNNQDIRYLSDAEVKILKEKK